MYQDDGQWSTWPNYKENSLAFPSQKKRFFTGQILQPETDLSDMWDIPGHELFIIAPRCKKVTNFCRL